MCTCEDACRKQKTDAVVNWSSTAENLKASAIQSIASQVALLDRQKLSHPENKADYIYVHRHATIGIFYSLIKAQSANHNLP